MTFEEILDQTIAMLRRRGRLTYRTLKRQFELDDEALDDLREELVHGQRLASMRMRASSCGLASQRQPRCPPQRQARTQNLPAVIHPGLSRRKDSRLPECPGRGAQAGYRLVCRHQRLHRADQESRPGSGPATPRPCPPAHDGCVHRFEGTVNQVLGDGIMALFGAPLAHEDHAARACYAALAMQAAMQRHTEAVRRTHGMTLRIRVGLNSGEVVVRAIGNDLYMDYSAVGSTTHLAARMEQLAAPGSIMLTAATLRLVEGLARVHDAGPVPIKGLTRAGGGVRADGSQRHPPAASSLGRPWTHAIRGTGARGRSVTARARTGQGRARTGCGGGRGSWRRKVSPDV